jgi:hypothetical protein
MLRNIGLTNINLEELVETGCVGESLFPKEKTKEEKRQDRIKARRLEFMKAMKGTSMSHWKHQQTNYDHIVRNNPMVEKWLKMDDLSVEEINQLLDDTEDILREAEKNIIGGDRTHAFLANANGSSSVRRQPPQGYKHPTTYARGVAQHEQRARVISAVRRKLHFGTQPSLSPQRSTFEVMPEPSIPLQGNKIHKMVRTMFARPLAGTKSTSKAPICTKRYIGTADDNANPPIWERSRSLCSRGNTPSSLALNNHISKAQEKIKNYGDTKKPDTSMRDIAEEAPYKSLRSRTISTPTKTKRTPKLVHWKEQKEQEIINSETKCNQNEPLCSSLTDWVKMSEDWINKPLNQATIIEFL